MKTKHKEVEMDYEIVKVNLDNYAKELVKTAIAGGEDLKQLATNYVLIANRLLRYANAPEQLEELLNDD